MRSASYADNAPPRGGFPRWSLFAAIPLVLALGFVSGIALSTYWPGVSVSPMPAAGGQNPSPAGESGPTSPAPDQPSADQTAPVQNTGSLKESPDSRRPESPSSLLPPAVDEPWPYLDRSSGPAADPPPAANHSATPAAPAEVLTVVDARTALAAEFPSFTVGGVTAFSVDYQLARDIDYSTVLIGIVKIAEYGQWVRAVQERPAELQAWLKAAAERVRPAAQAERFTLTWTIYERLTDPPYGFSAKEVTRDPRGDGYVVTRALAAVTDVARSTVTIASVTPASRPATVDTPWAAYGPVIRFDPTDLYRPITNKP